MTAAPPGAIVANDHGGQPLGNRNLFVNPPREIGTPRSCYSTLAAGVVPRTQAKRLVSTALWGLGFLIGFTILNPLLGLVAGIVGGLIGWFKTGFKHTVTWVGRDGIARYVCKGSTSQMVKNEVLRFDAATELRTSATKHYRNGVYTGTSYTHTWTDSGGRALMTITGMYRAKTGMPASTDPYLFAVAAEASWSEALLARIEQEFRVKGSVEFHLTGPDFVRLGNGWIELSIKGKSDRREAKDIAKVELQKGRFTVEMVDAKKGFFSSTGVFGFDYGALSNARVFMLVLSRLTGLQLS